MQEKKIVGHAEKLAKLRRMLYENRLPHALLFTGTTGIGKRLVAETLLREFLCAKRNFCGECPSCLAWRAGTHGDYHLLEPEVSPGGKRTIKIDAIRNLQSELAKFPVLSHGRGVLIDGADTMNEQAMNALLKTLEEPTGEVLFILIAASPSSLLPTIISRCMRVAFGALPFNGIISALLECGVNEPQARRAAYLADGSLGRALVLTNEADLSLADAADDFLAELKQMGISSVWDKSAMLDKLGREKVTEWLRYVIFGLRDLLIQRLGAVHDGQESNMPLFYHEKLPSAANFSLLAILKLLRLTADTQKRMSANVNVKLQLEGFMIRAHDAVR